MAKPKPRKCEDVLACYDLLTANSEPRWSYRHMCGVCVLSSVMQRKMYYPIGSLTLFPNFYIILVGPPAARKGTAIEPARRLLDRTGVLISADESSRQKLINVLAEKKVLDIDLDGNQLSHSSITILASELTVFLGYNNSLLLSTLCDWFDCRPTFKYDTIGRGEEVIKNVWATMLGATTPELMRNALPQEAVGSGFMSRVIIVYEDNKSRAIARPTEPDGLFEDIVWDLQQIEVMSGRFREDADYWDAYAQWYEHMDTTHIKDRRLSAYTERRAIHATKLAMVYSISRDNEMVLRLPDWLKARTTLEHLEGSMHRAFIGQGQNPLGAMLVQIEEYIKERGTCHTKDLQDHFKDEVLHDELHRILTTLESSNRIAITSNLKLMYKYREGEDNAGRRQSSKSPDKSGENNGAGNSGVGPN